MQETKHLKNVFESEELQENMVSSILEHTTQHGAISGKTQIKPTNNMVFMSKRPTLHPIEPIRLQNLKVVVLPFYI